MKTSKISGLLLTALLITTGLNADIKPAALFTDNMVIQQQTEAAIWGHADPGERVVASASWGQSSNVVTGDDGKWILRLKTPKAETGNTQSYTLTLEGTNRVTIENVLIGDVWLASGQSNMEWKVARLEIDNAQLGNCDLPLIREYTVERNATPVPADDTKGHWKIASRASIDDFSATAWFFARKLHEELNIPIGILSSSWGGTPIESWLSKASQASHAPTQLKITQMDAWTDNFDPVESQKRHETAVAKWEEKKSEAARLDVEFNQRKPRLVTPESRLQRYPGNLYAGMIRPLVPYGMRGVIWYQGEANSQTAEIASFYERQLTDLVLSWRDDWQNAEMPFYVVQLANFRAPQVNPVEYEQFWPITRESMRKATGKLDNAGMAVAIDIGEAGNIHPRNKWELGRRLALLTLYNDYGHELVPSGPLYKSFTTEGNNILIDFDHKGSGLVAKDDDELQGFAIAGDDGNYVWAEARIVSRSNGWKFWQKEQVVEVHSQHVSDPKSVKYGWADNPDTINLYNKEGLPASPFSTD